MDSPNDPYIVCSDGTRIYYISRDTNIYKDKVTLLYGDTCSGKSTILKDILYMLRDEVSIAIAFAPTDYIDKSFKNMIPEFLIFREVDVDSLKSIWEAQKKRAKKYRTANNLNVLYSLFKKIASEQDRNLAKIIVERAEASIKDVTNNDRLDWGNKKNEKLRIGTNRDKNLSKLFKDCIRKGINKFRDMNLDNDEDTAKTYLDFNPRIVLIFDDCLSTAAKWKNEGVFKQMFMEGRHSFMTQIYTLQDDKGIPPDLRKNARTSIFTSGNCASTHFEARSNGYSTSDKSKAKKMMDIIFARTRGAPPHYRKLVYNKDDPDLFGVTIADVHDDEPFQVGSHYTWKYTEKLPRKNKGEHTVKRDRNEYLTFRT